MTLAGFLSTYSVIVKTSTPNEFWLFWIREKFNSCSGWNMCTEVNWVLLEWEWMPSFFMYKVVHDQIELWNDSTQILQKFLPGFGLKTWTHFCSYLCTTTLLRTLFCVCVCRAGRYGWWRKHSSALGRSAGSEWKLFGAAESRRKSQHPE